MQLTLTVKIIGTGMLASSRIPYIFNSHWNDNDWEGFGLR